MDSLIGILISSFVIALSGALVPGPVLSLTVSESTKRGFMAGPMIILGHGVLEVVLIGIIFLGFADVINNEKILGTVGIMGGGALLWMSINMLKDIRHINTELVSERKAWGGPIVAGALTSLANPYWIIWWMTIGLGYVLISLKFGLIGLFVFFLGHISADLLWYSLISFMVSRGRRHLSKGLYRGILGICALILIFFGISFTVWGVGNLINMSHPS